MVGIFRSDQKTWPELLRLQSCLKTNVKELMFCEMHLMNRPDSFIVHEDYEGMKGQLKNIIKRPWESDEPLKQIWELSKEIQHGQAQ
jgi:hypothetical protein